MHLVPQNNTSSSVNSKISDEKVSSESKATECSKNEKGNMGDSINGNINKNNNSAHENSVKGISDAMAAIVGLVNRNSAQFCEQMKEFNKTINNQNIKQESLQPQRLDIEIFNGDILSYASFKNIFQQAVSKCQWTKLELLLFLRSKLSGNALARVQHLAIEECNYDLTWKTLDEEYLVPRLILRHNIYKLLNQPFVKYNDVNGMRQFYTNLHSVVTNLKQLEDIEPIDWLFEIGYTKIDTKLKQRYEAHLSAKELKPTVENITQFLMRVSNSLNVNDNVEENM
jgi:hypothetical protein